MILCADDFGMTEDINRAVTELARAGKIHAVSCMVNLPFFTAEQLSDLGSVKLGLHFTLAETPQEFRNLVFSAYTRRLNRDAVYRKLSDQFERFEEASGRRPDFIDGHLHIQQLPVIRDVVIEFIQNRCAGNPPHVRNAAMPLRQCSLKSLFIAAPGRALKRKLLKAGIPTNNGFGGIYNYSDFMRYPQHLEKFLRTIPENGIIMVHPGLNEPWRRAEYDALSIR
ncbi:MAG: ChbG/HpnK family deacetylase [Kiritimatiellales bacterium]|nr:ChbG/HpnK family deacetylase [Kiritimatiellales bacterium]